MPKTLDTSIKKILISKPQPLFSYEHQLALFWSSKSGCTFAIKWFFYQLGMLDVALFYNEWVHHFREECFFRSQQYRRHIEKISDPQVQVVKVVRNPFSRAAASYVHAIRTGYEDEKIAQFLNRDIHKGSSFSFREFLNYLENIDLYSANNHHRVQLHPSEQHKLIKVNHIIHLENSFEQLKKLEQELNLRKSDFEKLRKSDHHSVRQETDDFCGDQLFCARGGQRTKSFPKTKNFYNDALKEKVANLYRVDFDSYGYDDFSVPGD